VQAVPWKHRVNLKKLQEAKCVGEREMLTKRSLLLQQLEEAMNDDKPRKALPQKPFWFDSDRLSRINSFECLCDDLQKNSDVLPSDYDSSVDGLLENKTSEFFCKSSHKH
jgi:hypothetical protein